MKKDPYAPLGPAMDEKPKFWRSLEHKEGDPLVKAAISLEFPDGPPLLANSKVYSRRDALKLAGAGAGTAAVLSSCDAIPLRRPEEEILPFVRAPEKVIPGIRKMYATALPRAEGALGVLVEAHEGRPTKIEGHPDHPSSLGSTDVWAQAEVLRIYDPERREGPVHNGSAATWDAWEAFAQASGEAWGQNGGKGVAILAEEHDGPTFARLLNEFKSKYSNARLYRWDPLCPDATLLGASIAYSAGTRVAHDLTKVKTIFSLDSDFLASGPQHIALARQFGASRAIQASDDLAGMMRLYAAEGIWSVTGTNADHRLRIAPGLLPEVLKDLAHRLVTVHGVDLGPIGTRVASGSLPEDAQKFVAAVAKDLANHRGAAVVMVGERQPAEIHALGHAINAALESPSPTVLRHSADPRESMYDSLAALTKALNNGDVDTLIIFEANPVYTAPGGLKFGEALKKAKTVIHAALFPEETGAQATWHVPIGHSLESWGDAHAFDGTVSLIQPLIHPLFGGRSQLEILSQLLGVSDKSDKNLVEDTWRKDGATLASATSWRTALHDGLLVGSGFAVASGAPDFAAVAEALGENPGSAPSTTSFDLVADFGHAQDGRLTNSSWIMELPDSITKLCWDNAALMAPATAHALGIKSHVSKNKYSADVVVLEVDGRTIHVPVFVFPGISENTIAIHHGYGRKVGEVAKEIGVDVNPLLARGNTLRGVKVTRTEATATICSTQDHFSVPGNPFHEMTFEAATTQKKGAPERTLGLGSRQLYRSGTASEYKVDAEKIAKKGEIEGVLLGPSLGTTRPTQPVQGTDAIVYEGQQWGMVIDLSSCIGCSACTIACQAENNISTVGRDQVLLGREMHWMRVDRYFFGDVSDPTAVHQPVNCMQCENAPCEPVCPVGATTHDEEGLNAMAYNRCIGTRYCSNNCPYKVRRFNYLDYSHTGDIYVEPYWKERMKTFALQRNPDVSVRYRGVMEKCTYCTQRVEEAKIAAKGDGADRKALPDGAVTPACAQVCPTHAITFGNIHDEKSRVANLKKSARNYEMLQELNIRPRTTYLARVRNENEELA